MVGQTVSHYEVLEELGRGGMGAVYKARDTMLGRVLAIKLLRPDIANTTRERRFIQEAKAASSLNHPNIVTIYEIFHSGEAACIAMEYVSGKTLEHVLEAGPMPLRKGLDCAVQIADALAKAHAAGIVHRDIKPSNIIVTDTGLVKILDFGLAKLTQTASEDESGERLTQDGRVVGTPPYLSPEQAKAEKVDARSEIFSFGTVLYEMFTGKRPFERASNVEMLAAVVQDRPKKIRSIAKDLPSPLEDIISKCLEKNVEKRFQRMEDVRDALDAVRQRETLDRLLWVSTTTPARWRSWKLWIPAAALAAGAAGFVLWSAVIDRAPRHAPVLTRMTSDEGLTTDPAVSPDGKYLAYASDRGGETLDIWIQPLAGGEAVRLTTHPADDHEPSFSPDGSKIAFRSERDGGGVYVKSIVGGDERLIVRKGRRPRFSPDGKWIAYWTGFSTGDPTSPGSNAIFIVPSDGGVPKQMAPQFESALYPVWSPDGNALLFLGADHTRPARANVALSGTNRPVNRVDWWIAKMDGSPPVKTGVHDALIKQGLSVWASAGAGIAPEAWQRNRNEVIFSASMAATNAFRDTVNLWSIPLSRKSGRPADAARQLTFATAVEFRPALTASGDLFFASAELKTNLWMLPVDANTGAVTGELQQLTKGAAFHGQPAAALGGNKVVYYSTKSGNMDIWILDLETGKESQLTSTPIAEASPLISADGSTVYYSIYGKREAYLIAARGGEATKICDDCGAWDVSHDGTRILYWYSIQRPMVSIGMLHLPSGQKSELIQYPEYSLYQPHFSPDDRWIAFVAKIGQDRSRIYITPFRTSMTHGGDAWVAVTDGENLDDKPRWSPDGNLMYFTSERDGFRCIWAQRLDPMTKRSLGPPFSVYHFHTSRRSLMNVGLGPLEISVARNALIFNLGEITGNIWRASGL